MNSCPAGLTKEQSAYYINSHALSRIDRQTIRAIHDTSWHPSSKSVNPALLPGNLNFAHSKPQRAVLEPQITSDASAMASSRSTARSLYLTARSTSRAWLQVSAPHLPRPERSTYASHYSATSRVSPSMPGGEREVWNLGRQGKQFTSHDSMLFSRI
jgi:hypothetical protein